MANVTLFWGLLLIAAGAFLCFRYRDLPRQTRVYLGEARRAVNAIAGLQAHVDVLHQTLNQTSLPCSAGESKPSPFASGHWDLVGGDGVGWERDLFYKVRGLAVHNGLLYASITGPKPAGPHGEVWCLEMGRWTCVGSDRIGPWRSENSSVEHLFSTSAGLVVAERRGVWLLGRGGWSFAGGLDCGEKSGPYCVSEWRGQLVVGHWGVPRVSVMLSDSTWRDLPNPPGGWGVGARTIYSMAAWNGHLYVGTGTGKFHGPSSTVWRFDGNDWEQVAGQGIRGSWLADGIPFVLSLTPFNDRLIATLSRPPGMASAASNVWVFDGVQWGALNPGRVPKRMADSLIMNDSVVFQDRLVVATGHSTRAPAEIWELANSSEWKPVGPPRLKQHGSGDGGWWIYKLCTDGDHLYASTAGHRGAATILRFSPDEQR